MGGTESLPQMPRSAEFKAPFRFFSSHRAEATVGTVRVCTNSPGPERVLCRAGGGKWQARLQSFPTQLSRRFMQEGAKWP